MGNDRPTDVQAGRVTKTLGSTPKRYSRAAAQHACVLFVLFAAFATAASSQDLTRLTELVSRGSTEQKRNALAELRGLRSPEASRIAIAALGDGDELVRASAINAAVFLPDAEATAASVPLLSDKAEFIRREAAYALGEAHAVSAVPALIKTASGDRENIVRAAAAAALGKTGSIDALPALTAILKRRPREEDEYLRRAAARSIGQIAEFARFGRRSGAIPASFLPGKFKTITADTAVQVDTTPFAEPLRVLLKAASDNKETADTRREAAYALGAIGDPAARGFLNANQGSSDTYLAEICREALLKIVPTK